MKKVFLSLLVLIMSTFAYAGSSSCTDTATLSWHQSSPYYTLQPSDCIMTVVQAEQGTTSLLSYLPASPSDGDEFTLKDGTGYATDTCGSYYSDPSWGGDGNTYAYCQPAGYGFQAQGDALIDDGQGGDPVQGYTDSEFYLTACNGPTNQACTPEQLPSYWADYQRKRYQMKVVFSSTSGNWNLTRSAQ